MTHVPQELVDYLHTMVIPDDGLALVILDIESTLDLSAHPESHFHGIIARGTPTPSQAAEFMRVLRPGGHVMLISPEENPLGDDGACEVEDVGFEIRDAICVATEAGSLMYVPKAATKERNAGLGKHGNSHPTVKPVSVMEILFEDVPTDEPVADIFLGSGTTALAALRTGHSFIGVEKEAPYLEVATRRVQHGVKKLPLAQDVRVTSDVLDAVAAKPTSALMAFFGGDGASE